MAMKAIRGRFEPSMSESEDIRRVQRTIVDALSNSSRALLMASGSVKRNRALIDKAGYVKEVNDLIKAIEAVNAAERSWSLMRT